MTIEEYKREVIKILEEEKWYPDKSTDEEAWKVSKMLNAILEKTIIQIMRL